MRTSFAPLTSLLRRLTRRQTTVAVLLIFAATLAAYGTTLFNGLHFDDETLILNNYLLREPSQLPQLLGTPFLEIYYRPVVFFSFFIDYRLWGASPAGFHLTNILLHLANALLVFFFIRLLFGNHRLATLTGILFAVHPVQAVALNYVADRGNLLAAFFVLSGLVFFLQSLRRPAKARNLTLLSGLFFIGALFSRENAVLFPLLAGITVFIAQKDATARSRVFVGETLLVTLIFLAVRRAFIPFSGALLPDAPSLFSWQNLTAFSYIVFSYLRGMVVPGDIHMIREMHLPAWGGVEMILFPLLLTGLIVLCLASARRRNPVFFASAWFLTGVLPLYGFIFSRPHLGFCIQDNQMYLASLGPLLLIAFGLERLGRFMNKKIWLVLVVVLSVAYAGRAVSFNRLYNDEEAFLKEWLRLSPRSELAAFYLASLYEKGGQTDKALLSYRRSLNGTRLDAKALTNIGVIYFDKGEHQRAGHYYREALNRDPALTEALYGLALISLHGDDFAQAERRLVEAIRSDPDGPLARLELVKLYTKQGRIEEALQTAQDLKERFPSLEETYYMLVWLHLAQNDPAKALAVTQELLPRAADLPQACGELAGLFEEAGHHPLARTFREQAGKEDNQ